MGMESLVEAEDVDPPEDTEETNLLHNDNVPIIQFSCSLFYASEGETEVQIDVVRLGDKSGTCKADYYTKAASAKPGVKYVETRGTLTFGPGQLSARFPITILDDARFDATLDFAVHLANPQNADLGLYLHSSRVRINDDDCYPSNKYADQLRSHKEHLISPWGLMREYARMNWLNPVIRKGAIKSLIVDQLENLNYIWRVLLMIYLIDEVLIAHINLSGNEDSNIASEGDGDCSTGRLLSKKSLGISSPKTGYLIVAMLYVLPMVLLHVMDIRQCYWKISGTARKNLQENLLRKFLHYDEASRQRVSGSDFSMAILRDVNELVGNGYMKMFAFLQQALKLVIVLLYQAMSGAFLHGDFESLYPLLIMPIMVIIFLRLRSATIHRLKHEQAICQNELAHQANEITDAYRLIADYHERSFVIERFSNQIRKYNRSTVKNNVCFTNNRYFIPWMTSIVIALYMVLASPKVQDGTIALGQFLGNLAILSGYGASIKDLYNTILTIESSFSALYRITFYMNLPVDVPKRLQMSRRRQKRGSEARASIVQDLASEKQEGREARTPSKEEVRKSKYAIDLVPLEIKDLSFGYPDHVSSVKSKIKKPMLRRSQTMLSGQLSSQNELRQLCGIQDLPESFHGNAAKKTLVSCRDLSIPQGRLVSISGLHGVGKKSVLQLLGDVLLPDEGECFIPPHLRVLHVQDDPYILNGSLMDNVSFGSRQHIDMDRTREVCNRLGMDDKMLAILDDEEASSALLANNGSLLCESDRQLISIARALVYNPEVLVIHKPLVRLSKEKRPLVMQILREYVDQRGFQMDPATRHRRRPRTCIYSSSQSADDEAKHADVCLVIENKQIIRHEPPDPPTLDDPGGPGAALSEQLEVSIEIEAEPSGEPSEAMVDMPKANGENSNTQPIFNVIPDIEDAASSPGPGIADTRPGSLPPCCGQWSSSCR